MNHWQWNFHQADGLETHRNRERRVTVIIPIGDINRRLKIVRDAKFEFMPEIDLVETRVVRCVRLPGRRIFKLDYAGRSRRRFVNKSETARAAESNRR